MLGNIRNILERKLKHYRIRTFLFELRFAVIPLKCIFTVITGDVVHLALLLFFQVQWQNVGNEVQLCHGAAMKAPALSVRRALSIAGSLSFILL